VIQPGKRHRTGGRGPRLGCWLLLGCSAALSGCGIWDDFRSRDYSFKSYFVKENPLVVLTSPTADGNKRARAFAELREPKQHGGDQETQDVVVRILVTAARSEPQSWCRLKAIEALSTFKDPRAVQGLQDAYYEAKSFPPETRTAIRCQALAGLGRIGNPDAVDMLVTVVQQPPPEPSANNEEDKQFYLDERLAAAEALANFKQHYRSLEALTQILKTEKDVALRDRACQSLQVATGKKLPAEFQPWDDYLHPPGGGAKDAVAGKGTDKAKLGPPVIQRTSGQNDK
jgi:hypothetical protein